MKGFLNFSQAAKHVGVTRPTLYKWLERGLSSKKVGGLRLINVNELEKFASAGANNYRRG